MLEDGQKLEYNSKEAEKDAFSPGLPKAAFMQWFVLEDDVEIDGIITKCFRLDATLDEAILDEWATHIRRHYRRDSCLEETIERLQCDRSDYLKKYVIPSVPQIKSGDFAEIVISDLLEFVEECVVSRYKHLDRTDKDSSEHGSDVIAYQIEDPNKPAESDKIFIVEVKSQASSTNLKKALSDAGRDSSVRDKARLAFTLDYHLRRSLQYDDQLNADAIARFMRRGEHPCEEIYCVGAIAGVKDARHHLGSATSKELCLSEDSIAFIIHKPDLMSLIHDLYARCCL